MSLLSLLELSIIIPTLNRASSLEKTLQSITEQEAVFEPFEVIVVDNGSSDATAAICKSFENRIDNFLYTYDSEPGQLTGRHRGTMLSSGGILSFLDDDVEINPGWVNSVLKVFNDDPSAAIVGGPSLPKYQEYPPAWAQYFSQPTPYGGNMCLPLSLIDIGVPLVEVDPVYIFGLNYSIRKKHLLALGGFHPDCIPHKMQRYQGDGETGLSLKAKAGKLKAVHAASTMLYHQVSSERLQPEYFMKWYFYNGVCQSFTDLRLKHHLYQEDPGSSQSGGSFIDKVLVKTGEVFRKVVNSSKKDLPEYILKLQESFNKQYHEGYQFHQHAFDTDISVKEWVLKSDYWNYKLPV